MPIGSLSIYILCMLLTGYTALALIARKRMSVSTVLAVSVTLGGAVLAFLLFYLDLMGMRPGRGAMMVIAALDILVLAALLFFKRLSVPSLGADATRFRWADIFALIPLALVVYVLWVVGLAATHYPMEWDAWAFWIYKAKILAAHPLLPKPEIVSLPAFTYAHPRYPILWPLLGAGAYGMTLTRDDHVARAMQVVMYAGLFLTLYTGLRWKISRIPAMAVAALGISMPSLIHWAGVGYGDLLLTGFYAAMVYFVARWTETRAKADLLLGALFAAGGAFTKNEGLALGCISLLIIGVFGLRGGWRKAASDAGVFAVAFLAPMLPWFFYIHPAPHDPEDYTQRLSPELLWKNLDRLPTIFSEFWREWINWEHWGPLWPLLIIMAIAGWKAWRKPSVLATWAMLLMHALLYVYIFVITTWNLAELIPVALERLMIHLTPAAVLLIGWHGAPPSPTSAAQAKAPMR